MVNRFKVISEIDESFMIEGPYDRCSDLDEKEMVFASDYDALREAVSALRIAAYEKHTSFDLDNRMLLVKMCEDALGLPIERRITATEPK